MIIDCEVNEILNMNKNMKINFNFCSMLYRSVGHRWPPDLTCRTRMKNYRQSSFTNEKSFNINLRIRNFKVRIGIQ